jgi:hypothetical protein
MSHWVGFAGDGGLGDSPDEYLHSSACFYATGVQGHYAVTNYLELKDVDLSRLVE